MTNLYVSVKIGEHQVLAEATLGDVVHWLDNKNLWVVDKQYIFDLDKAGRVFMTRATSLLDRKHYPTTDVAP
jgi:hypothetical protein